MDSNHDLLNRRHLLAQAGGGLGALAFADLLHADGLLEQQPAPHFPPTAKSAIWLFIEGGPSAMDTFDPNASCASCHRLIDPPGFALESFDVMGGWRERYRSTQSGDEVPGSKDNKPLQYKLGLQVESFGELPDGRQFSGIDEFRALLLEKERQLAENLLRKLVVVAMGADVGFVDEAEYQQMLEELRLGGYAMCSMVHAIVQSQMFGAR